MTQEIQQVQQRVFLLILTVLFLCGTARADIIPGNDIQKRLFGTLNPNVNRIIAAEATQPGYMSFELNYQGAESHEIQTSGLLVSALAGTAIGAQTINTERADMLNLKKRSMVAGAIFLPAVLTGFWLTQQGTPPPTWLVTGHKLFMLADLVYLNKTFFEAKHLGLASGQDLAAMGTMNLFFVGTIATGALLTLDKEMPQAVTTAHHVTPWLTVASSALMLYLLGR